MKKSLLFLLCIFLLTSVSAEIPLLCLKQKFMQGKGGDFIVTAQNGHYSLLFIRMLTADRLFLEEISIPEQQIDLKKINWKKWVEDKAPGHTSWTLSEIDLHSGILIECFSYSKNGWLYLDPSEQFLIRLLMLPLFPVSEKERKRIGPPPSPEEVDRRALWNPPLIIEGKKRENPIFEVLTTTWPEDDSQLSLCSIELYFSQEGFPFPYWLEVHSPHYTFKMRAIDSGHGIVSPILGPMPYRPPQFLGLTQRGKESWKIAVQTPSYFQTLHLFALDLTAESKMTIPVPFTVHKGEKKEEWILEIALSTLKQILHNDHRYQWVLIPEGSTSIYVESEETFTWNIHLKQ